MGSFSLDRRLFSTGNSSRKGKKGRRGRRDRAGLKKERMEKERMYRYRV
jgi:hypothetical protein